jgi:RNA polymerase sigma-70 factor (ECF subfamily)
MWRVQTQDDHRAFAGLLERWEGPIYSLCVRMTGDPHRGEDLKQEAFARVFEKRKSYNPELKFSTWLWRIALNICYDELRRRQRRPEFSLHDEDGQTMDAIAELPVSQSGPDSLAAQEEEGGLVRAALMQLPEIYRSVLVLRHYEGLKLREIAEVLEIPEGTVNSRMAEAISLLAKLLEETMGPRPTRLRPRRLPRQESLLV